ncbi:16462_t:CDS:2, partial [Racocetra persica]
SPNDTYFFNSTSPNRPTTSLILDSYIEDIENYMIMIEHSARINNQNLVFCNQEIDSSLIYRDKKGFKYFKRESGMKILNAAKVSLDGEGRFTSKTYRESGI